MLTNSVIQNSSANEGGGVWAQSGSGSLSLTNVTIQNSSAEFGGGMYIRTGGLSVTGSTIRNNRSSYSGRGNHRQCFLNSYLGGNGFRRQLRGVWWWRAVRRILRYGKYDPEQYLHK